MSKGTGFSSSSKLLQKKWDEKSYQMHRQKMQSMRSDVSVYRQTKQFPHLVLKMKKIQQEEERQASIDHNNQLLLQKMTHILKSPGRVDNWNEYESRSLNICRRGRQQEKIAEENVGIARRLGAVRPIYHVNEWEDDYNRYHYYRDLWASSTKDYTLSPRGRKKYADDYYESDFEEEDDSKLPKIDSRNENRQDGTGSRAKKESSATKLPAIDKKQKKKKKPPNQKTIEWAKQDAAAESDAKLLFKATQNLAKPEEMILKTLIRKSHNQRMVTKDKFYDLYDLDLQTELCNINQEYQPLVECLLAERETRDADAINSFVHDNDVSSLISVICSRNHVAINYINKAYKDKYDVSVQEDIESRILNDDCQKLLIALLSGNKSKEGEDDDRATNDAQELFKAEKGRFSGTDGKFLQIISKQSFPQIKTTFNAYKKVSDGEDIPQAMKADGSSTDYIKAVQTIMKCMNGGATFNTEKIHSLIKSGQKKDLISLLLARAEIDMPDIRKAYKKKYGTELIDDIMSKCGKDVGPLIAQVAAKGPKPANKQEQGKGSQSKGKPGLPSPGPSKRSPIRRPPPKKDVEVKDSPLAQPGVKPHERLKQQQQLQKQQQKEQQQKKEQQEREKKEQQQKQEKEKKEQQQKQEKDRKEQQQKEKQKREQEKEQQKEKQKKEQHEKEQKQKKDEKTQQKQTQQKSQQQKQQQDNKKQSSKRKEGQDSKSESKSSDSTSQKSQEKSTKDKYPEQKQDKSQSDKDTADNKSDPEEDAEKIHEAIKGFGTDEQALIDILTQRTNEQRQDIQKKYKEKYDKELTDVMKSELRGDFEEITLALLMTPLDYEVFCLHDAMHGPGTKESALIGILCTRNAKQLEDIKSEYKKKYDADLDSDLKGDTTGQFEEMLIQLCKGERAQGDKVDQKQAEEDAKKLYKSDEEIPDLQGDTFRDILCKQNKAQLRVTFDEYQKLAGHSIADGIEKAWITMGDAADGYSGLVEAIQDPVVFYAKRLNDAVSGLGTNDTQLIRIVVSRSEIDLPAIKSKFKELYEKDLDQIVDDECSGDYKKMLLAIVRGKK